MSRARCYTKSAYLITITRERTTNTADSTPLKDSPVKPLVPKKYGDTNTACVLPRLERVDARGREKRKGTRRVIGDGRGLQGCLRRGCIALRRCRRRLCGGVRVVQHDLLELLKGNTGRKQGKGVQVREVGWKVGGSGKQSGWDRRPAGQ